LSIYVERVYSIHPQVLEISIVNGILEPAILVYMLKVYNYTFSSTNHNCKLNLGALNLSIYVESVYTLNSTNLNCKLNLGALNLSIYVESVYTFSSRNLNCKLNLGALNLSIYVESVYTLKF